MRFTYKNLLIATAFVIVAAWNCPMVSAQDWLMTKTDELKGEYGEIAKNLQTTTNEKTLIEILEQPGTENEMLYLKMLACKRLATHGTKDCLPALVKMLGDPKAAHFARYAMEPIPGEEVDQALWDATKNLKGLLLVGVVDSIGIRNNPKAEPILGGLIATENSPGQTDPEVGKAIISAAGKLAGDQTVKLFTGDIFKSDYDKARKAFGKEFADAAFNCAEVLKSKGRNDDAVKIYQTVAKMDGAKDFQKESAVYNEILTLGEKGTDLLVKQIQSGDPKMFAVAMKAARELPVGETVTKILVEQLGKIDDPQRKAQLVLAIGDRKDDASKRVSLTTIVGLAKSEDVPVRQAVIVALKNIGDSSVLPLLIDAATDKNPQIAEAAKATLENIPGKEVDDAIVTLLDKNDSKTKTTAIELVEQRRIARAFPALRVAAKSDDENVRKAALKALSEVVTISNLSTLVDVLAEAKDDKEFEANQWVMKAATSRMPQEEVAAKVVEIIDKATDAEKQGLMEVLMQIGGNTAVDAVGKFAESGSTSMKDKATELLGKWREPNDANKVAEICLKIAKESTDNKYKNRGLRGYIRYPRQFTMLEPQRIEMVREFLKLAQRKEDKVLVFQAFTRYPSAKMLEEVMTLLGDDSVKEEACSAAVTVADKIQGASQATADAMKKVMETTAKADTKAAAQRVLDRQ